MPRTVSQASVKPADVSSSPTAGGLRSLRFDVAETAPSEPSPAFRHFAAKIRSELNPVGPLETVLVDRAIAAAWTMGSEAEEGTYVSGSDASRAERSLIRMLSLLERLRESRTKREPAPRTDEPAPTKWRDRLDLDTSVSPTSPVIRGTWISVDQVIALIVDGASWKDILRTYPELTEDDLRACLSYSVGDADH